MKNLSDSADQEFTELYNRIERTYNIGRLVVIGLGIAAMLGVYIYQ